MDYKEKYEQALERARKLQENSNGMILKKWLWDIFPELKESEGERIRKEIIEYIKTGTYHKNWIAWLEKQVPVHLSHDDEIMIRQLTEYFTTGKGLQNTNDTVVEWLADVKRKLEKQGEQKPDKIEPKFKVKYANSEYNVLEIKEIAGVTYYGIEDEPNHIDYVLPDNCEIVSEQKLAYKIEPKFHEGDWVIFNNHHGSIYQVEKIKNYQYFLRHYLGGSMSIRCDSELIRLWTIQDAKSGDVLAYRDGQWIFIYKEKVDDNSFYYHTLYSTIHQDLTINDSAFTLLGDAIIPATKEQRDLLFSKMKEAGYELDAEKKELKKIEQTIEIPFGAKDSELQEITYYIPKGFYAEIDDDKVVIKKGEKPTTWSEEDEMFVHGLIRGLAAKRDIHGHTTFSSDCIDITEAINWLNSIKGRVQPKQKWSEEDEKKIKKVMYILGLDGRISNEELKSILDWLKSLRPQKQWKPSEEQIICLQDAINDYHRRGYKAETLETLFKQLKQL